MAHTPIMYSAHWQAALVLFIFYANNIVCKGLSISGVCRQRLMIHQQSGYSIIYYQAKTDKQILELWNIFSWYRVDDISQDILAEKFWIIQKQSCLINNDILTLQWFLSPTDSLS